MINKKILIIGSQGFLGRNLNNYFSKLGYEVKTLSRLNGDLLDFESWKNLSVSEHFEAIYFCAERSGNQIFFEKNSSFDLIKHNQKLIINLDKFMQSLKNPTKLFTFGSLWTAFHKLEEIEEKNLFCHYHEASVAGLKITKIILFELIKKLNKFTQHKASIITTGTLYGPMDQSDHLIPSILSKLSLYPKELEMFGKGDSIRNYTFVEDLCFWLNEILKSNHICPDNIIVASDKNYPVQYVIETLASRFEVQKLIWGDRVDNFKSRVPNTKQFSSLYNTEGYLFRGIDSFNKDELLKWI